MSSYFEQLHCLRTLSRILEQLICLPIAPPRYIYGPALFVILNLAVISGLGDQNIPLNASFRLAYDPYPHYGHDFHTIDAFRSRKPEDAKSESSMLLRVGPMSHMCGL
jgi:hypothetical protein